jgi:hypothetical protein
VSGVLLILAALVGAGLFAFGVYSGAWAQRRIDSKLQIKDHVKHLDSQVEAAMERMERRSSRDYTSLLNGEEGSSEHPGGPPQPLPTEARRKPLWERMSR